MWHLRTTPSSVPHGAVVASLAACLIVAACAGTTAVAVPSPDPSRQATASTTTAIPLVIRNRGTFDVTVYVHRSQNAPGRRVGTVNGGVTQTFRIPEAELQAGRLLMLGVRTIAGRNAWVSPAVAVGTGQSARLDVMSNTGGDLSQSTLYMATGSGSH